MVPWIYPSPHHKRHHLNRFSRFCRAHNCHRLTGRLTDQSTDHAALSATIGHTLVGCSSPLHLVPRTTTTLGMRSFAVAGPVIWNSLPAALRTTTLSPLTFARHLKAHLFGWSAARLRTIYDMLYKSTHHYHHHHHHHLCTQYCDAD